MQQLLYREGMVRRTEASSRDTITAATASGEAGLELSLQERIVALTLQVDHGQSEAEEYARTIERIEDELFRAKCQL